MLTGFSWTRVNAGVALHRTTVLAETVLAIYDMISY